MPYKIMGKSVYKKVGKAWKKTATASSVENAKKMLSLLRQKHKELI